jgi:hypothetical protein
MTTPAAGWYPAPDGTPQESYWDGQAWTMETRPAGVRPQPSPQIPQGQKNWFVRHKVLSAVGALFLIGIIATAAGGGSKKTDTAVSDPLTSTTAPAPAPAAAKPTPRPVATKAVPAAPSKPNDKGWVVQSLSTRDDGLGDFGGIARVTNTNSEASTGVFTFTLSRGGQIIGTLQGSTDTARTGQTITVMLISQDKYSRGAYTYDFQTDTSYASG